MRNNRNNRTRFTIIGKGFFVSIFDKTHPLYIKLKSLQESDEHFNLRNYINDFRHFQTLDLKDEAGNPYSTFYEVKPSKIFPVYSLNDGITRLEIKRETYVKPAKKFFWELLEVWDLFPSPFDLHESTLENEGLLFLEKNSGHFGFTVHPRKFMSDDRLSFELINIPELNEKFVKTIKVNENEVILKQPETITTGNYEFLI